MNVIECQPSIPKTLCVSRLGAAPPGVSPCDSGLTRQKMTDVAFLTAGTMEVGRWI